ncbi:MAG: hypothetical protein H6733_06615 [Alphaproteobacteria bacterium]|nr:hypothetical protein [Alphaproteobacteria bacterium]
MVVGVAAWALRTGLRPADADLRAAIRTTLLDPYVGHLRQGDTTAAWTCCTTPAFRDDTPEIVFLAGQARNRDELGTVRDLRLADDPLEHHTEPGRGAFVRAVAWWEGGTGSARVVLDVVQADDGWKLDRTWTWPEHGLGTPRVW